MGRKKLTALVLALLMLLTAHLHVYCRVSVNGQRLEGLYRPGELKRSRAVAAAAAEELLPGEAAPPQLRLGYRLSLRAPDGDVAALTEALILGYPGIGLCSGVSVNGVSLGTVEDGPELYRRLRDYILGQMPNAAVFGNISGQLQVRPVYSRQGHETNYDDMLLLISGMAPVIYLDADGRLA